MTKDSATLDLELGATGGERHNAQSANDRKEAAPHYVLSIIVPAYNEEHRIASSLERLDKYLTSLPYECELIVVDDGSGEPGQKAIAEAVRKLSPDVHWRLLRHDVNKGKGAAVRSGCLLACGTYIAFIDADLATPPEALGDLLPALERGADLAVGIRRQTDGSDRRDERDLKRRLAGRLFANLTRLVLLPGLSDSQCPLKAFRKEAAKVIFPLQRIETWSFDAELLYISHQLDLEMAEVPVDWLDVGGSHVTLSSGLTELANILRIRWKHRGVNRKRALREYQLGNLTHP